MTQWQPATDPLMTSQSQPGVQIAGLTPNILTRLRRRSHVQGIKLSRTIDLVVTPSASGGSHCIDLDVSVAGVSHLSFRLFSPADDQGSAHIAGRMGVAELKS